MKTRIAFLLGTVFVAIPLSAEAARCSDGRDSNPNNNKTVDASTATTETPPPPPNEECIERDIYFMPGATGVFFQPGRSHAPFFGAGATIAPYQWSRNNDHFGPSQGSVYFGVAMLGSEKTSGVMTLYELGATASFERNSSRRWLIPYFGATVGGMTQSHIGTAAYVYPLGGMHFYWHRNLMIDGEGGYHFPFAEVDQTRGPRAQLTARFSLW
jgi:hypothetical protein